MIRSAYFAKPGPFLRGQFKVARWSNNRPLHQQSLRLRAQQQEHHTGNGSLDSVGYTDGASSSASGWLEDERGVARNYDAIMVLGGGLTASGGVPAWVQRRLDGSLHIWKQQSKPCSIVLLGAGTPHKPPVLGKHSFVLHEASVYADYLMDKGVGAAQLLKETQSYDTVGNGYFSLVIHALPAGWRNIAVVTSAFHMPRTRATFDYCYTLAGRHFFGSPAHFQLCYHPVSDAGLFDPAVIEARAVKEAAAVEAWRRNTAPLDTMHKFHEWLFATHLCYAVGRQGEWGRELDQDPRLLATY